MSVGWSAEMFFLLEGEARRRQRGHTGGAGGRRENESDDRSKWIQISRVVGNASDNPAESITPLLQVLHVKTPILSFRICLILSRFHDLISELLFVVHEAAWLRVAPAMSQFMPDYISQ